MEEARKRKEIETIIGTEKVDETIELLQKNSKGRELYLSLLRLLGREKGLRLYRYVRTLREKTIEEMGVKGELQ